MGSLHIPTRRENFNSHVSVSLGSDKIERSNEKEIESKHYSLKTRFDNT